MYYIVNHNTGRILESTYRSPSQDDLQSDANHYGCSVYVIEGQHYGMTADPAPDEDETEEDETQ